ncbi:MAG: Nif11-like leader peptide family natural product precursor [Lentisphaeria bacterium]|nr:Nif11-like leader peptide family natural product precursor [Lentisphaeria bacterium]
MAIESARAFCVRLMSDEDLRNDLGNVKTPAEVNALLGGEYDFTKAELDKMIGEFVGHKLAEGELENLIGGFFEEEVEAGNADAAKVIIEWLKTIG